MRRRIIPLLLSTALFLVSTCISEAAAAGEACSASQQCPKSSPCCGVGGTCGSGALQCAGGCQPMASFSAGSCLPNPICTDKNITFLPSSFNDPHTFWPILLHNGDPNNAPFTLDYGYLGKGPVGVLLELTAPTQTKLSTTDYMLYGNVQVEARHDPLAGLVFAFITMSDTKDEIDWEFTTSDPNDLQTNYFSQGVIADGTALSVNKSSISVSDWHTYGLSWQPDKLQWTVDGKVLRTVTRNQAGTNYPRSPSRIQLSVWAGGNSTNPPGVIAWSGGEIDWTSPTYTSQGFYSAEIRSFTSTCAAQKASGANTVGTGNTTTSWVYTGKTLNGEPDFALSTDPIAFLDSPEDDGHFGLPGYGDQSHFSQQNKNAWDGSGDTSGLSNKEINGSSSSSGSNSGGWLANNRTLSIAVPVIAAAMALAAIWALAVFCYRRRQRKNRAYNNELGKGVLAKSGVPVSSAAFNVGRGPKESGVEIGARKSSRYQALHDEEEEEYEEEEEEDATPMGAQRIGQGYGPAVGPRPGPMGREEWADSRGSLVSKAATPSAYSYASSNQGYAMNERPATRQYPMAPGTPATPGQHTVRGPYTPGMHAYTPAMHQTPAMHTTFGSPQQVPYASPQHTQRYVGGGGGGAGVSGYGSGQQPHPSYPQQHNARYWGGY